MMNKTQKVNPITAEMIMALMPCLLISTSTPDVWPTRNKLRLKEGKDPLLVPGVVKRGSANQMAKYMVSENEIRRPDTPLGRAKKMSDALDRGLDEDDIAVLFGCSVQTVRATLSLLDATQAVREAVEAGTVTVTQARQLASLKPEEQREKVSEIEAATAGTTGHEKARRQRAVLGEAKPRIKSRKEITKALETASGEYAAALRWVLGDKPVCENCGGPNCSDYGYTATDQMLEQMREEADK